MKNNKIQFLFILFISIFTSNVFGVDYFWLAGVPLEDGSRLGGVNVGVMSEDKLKKLFSKDLIVLYREKNKHSVKKSIRRMKFTDEIYITDRAGYADEEEAGVFLTRSLVVRAEDEKKFLGYIAIPAKHKVEDVKILNLVESKDENEIYLNAVKENKEGVLSAKAMTEVLSRKKYFSIFTDPENPRFATNGDVLFLDKKPVFYNFHGFSPFVNESKSIGFLLRIDGRLCFLGNFGYTMQRKGWIEKMTYGYYLIDLEKNRGYLPMHLREEK
ncbi:MAG: hypothetical protein QF441_00995 [Bacteriovoracaceae bacterium]|nr:hypothetical protein [Halobacteriovoraceae bacterium]MDP7319146.1 hypothetical protein [Bacteriovoracaceae bacterium]